MRVRVPPRVDFRKFAPSIILHLYANRGSPGCSLGGCRQRSLFRRAPPLLDKMQSFEAAHFCKLLIVLIHVKRRKPLTHRGGHVFKNGARVKNLNCRQTALSGGGIRRPCDIVNFVGCRRRRVFRHNKITISAASACSAPVIRLPSCQ